MGEVSVSAPGKVILHGEHAVVYGKAALAASLNLRTYVRLTCRDDRIISVVLTDLGLRKEWKQIDIQESLHEYIGSCLQSEGPSNDVLDKISSFLEIDRHTRDTSQLALLTFLYLYCAIVGQKGYPALHVQAASELPVGAGLGSSASFSTCLSAALLQVSGQINRPTLVHANGSLTWNQEELTLINSWAFQGERIIHGTPSGIDNSVATFGGALKFCKGQITRIESMPSLRILLTNTKVPRSTKVLVAGVRKRYDQYPAVLQPVMDSCEGITEVCQEIYREIVGTDNSNCMNCYRKLEEMIDINQNLLCVMGVSHDSLDQICRETLASGLHSKLTGAGGGGCAYTLIIPGTSQEVIDGLKANLLKSGYSCWETVVGGPGILQHSDTTEISHILR